jgi:sensor c-di-GMP phosphodiesterase-like protein
MRTLTAAGVALLIFLAGSAMLTVRTAFSQRGQASQTATRVMSRADRLLTEARQAMEPLTARAGQPCTAALQHQLEHQRLRSPYIQGIHLYQGRRAYCSSTLETFALPEPFTPGAREQLYLLPEIPPQPGAPVLAYALGKGESGVMVTLSTAPLVRRMTWHEGVAGLQTGTRVLLPDNRVMRLPPAWGGVTWWYSGLFDYSVFTREFREPVMARLWQTGKWGFVLTGLLALAGGWLCRRYLLTPPALSGQLGEAIRKGEIVPYYQPVMNAETGRVHGVEVLARWISGGREVAGPDAFIALAEAHGLMVPLTRTLLSRVLSDIQPLTFRLPEVFHLGVNLSVAGEDVRELERDLIKLKENLGRRIRVVVEVTESAPVVPGSQVVDMLQRLRLEGLQVALDDFGTGYASLAHLSRLPLDFLKVDRMFVRALQDLESENVLVDSIIALAGQLGLKVIAEGVETKCQAGYLLGRGVRLQQGYRWSQPLSARALARYLIWGGTSH